MIMNRKLFTSAGIFLLAISLPGMAGAGQMVLEIDPQKFLEEEAGPLKKCDNLHQTTGSCICCNWHVASDPAAEAIADSGQDKSAAGKWIGTKVLLENVNGTIMARINRVTPLYRLDSGATFTPEGTWNPRNANGERWVSEHAGIYKNRVVSAWNDLNGDGLVGVSDELLFDNGEPAKIVNVGVAVHVTTDEASRSTRARRPRQQQ
jgi:hypothetical protein